MTFSAPRFVVGLIMMVIMILAIVGVATRQFDVNGSLTALGGAPARVELFFFHRITTTPLGKTTVRTPRDDGFFDCVGAWDQFQAGFGFTLLGIIFSGFAFLLYVGSAFVPVGARVFPLWVLAGLATAAAVFLTIAWPLVEALESVGFCGHDFEGYTMTNPANAGFRADDVKKDYGHSLIISAWCVSIVGAAAAIYLLHWARKHPEHDVAGRKDAPAVVVHHPNSEPTTA